MPNTRAHQTEREARQVVRDVQGFLDSLRRLRTPVLKLAEKTLRDCLLHAYLDEEVASPFSPCTENEADVTTVIREYLGYCGSFVVPGPAELRKEHLERRKNRNNAMKTQVLNASNSNK